MDPFLKAILEAGFTERHAVHMADHTLAMRRNADTALHAQSVVNAVVASELLVSNDTSEFARTNAAIRVPTTLDHPNAVVGK